MLQAFLNIWRIKELRNKLLFTIGMLVIYRIGFFIPLPGVDQSALNEWAESAADSGVGSLINYVGIFTGGSLSQSTIFGLGIMPYISAAIIFQLLASVSERLKAIQKEGPAGRQKIQEYTRYATLGLCLVQSAFWLSFLQSGSGDLVYPAYQNTFVFWSCGVLGLTAGTIFLMWLGEQIDKYGIGNGVSLILTAGIISQMPNAVIWISQNFQLSTQQDAQIGPAGVIFLVAAFVFVVAGAILITVAQRRIPIQQARHTKGRRVYGGGRHYLPLRVNHAGVMPIIFATSLMIFPSAFFGYLSTSATANPDSAEWWVATTNFLTTNFQTGAFPYILVEILMIYFFSYFWTTVVFSPDEMSRQLRDAGSFIPGLRPGPRTAEYLETVVERITYVGAGFLAIIAIIPTLVSKQMNIPFQVSSFLGGTGLLIVVSVGLDLIQRIEANLLMRNYAGFLGGGEQGGRPSRVRSGRR